MRKIAFRIWDKEKNEMVYNPIDAKMRFLSMRSPNEDEVETHIGYSTYPWERFEFMQYTGLKDRNGKEIYEGDVVCTSLLIPGEVKWGDDIACFEVVHSLGSRGLFGYIKEGSGVLVIGNVHENPDLLKCTTHS